MEASEVKHADLKKGQLRNLLVATFASIFAYWAWSVISPLAKFYACTGRGGWAYPCWGAHR